MERFYVYNSRNLCYCQTLIKTRRDLRSSQLETKIHREQLQSARQRLESSDHRGIPSEWNRLSKSLNNVIKVVSNRKDITEYEQTIRQLTEDNERLKKQMSSLEAEHVTTLEKQKSNLRKEHDKEAAQYSKQISELIIDKELAASEASIKYDQLNRGSIGSERTMKNAARHWSRSTKS